MFYTLPSSPPCLLLCVSVSFPTLCPCLRAGAAKAEPRCPSCCFALQHFAHAYSTNKFTVNKSFGLDSPESNEILLLPEYLGPLKNIEQTQKFLPSVPASYYHQLLYHKSLSQTGGAPVLTLVNASNPFLLLENVS